MVTALSLMRGASSSTPMDRDDKVMTLARWLAHQRAVPVHMVEATALDIAAAASEREPLDGPRAPLVVQPRGALWLVGKLGGRALLHIFSDTETAESRARELATEEGVSLIVVGQGGEIISRWSPHHGVVKPTTAPMSPEAPKPYAVSPEPQAEAAPQAQPTPTPQAPVSSPPVIQSAASSSPLLPLEVRRHTGGWAVMLRGRVIATAPTREKARVKKSALASDPDFTANPQPDATA